MNDPLAAAAVASDTGFKSAQNVPKDAMSRPETSLNSSRTPIELREIRSKAPNAEHEKQTVQAESNAASTIKVKKSSLFNAGVRRNAAFLLGDDFCHLTIFFQIFFSNFYFTVYSLLSNRKLK